MTLRDEIAEQPVAIERAQRAAAAVLPAVADLLADRPSTHAVVAARGTSDNAARFAQYLWGSRNGLPVALATPSLYVEAPPHLHDALVVGISQSGASPDLVRVVEAAAVQGRPTVAVTNDPDSSLAAVADVVVPLDVGPEHAVAATKTYTGELAAVATLAAALPGGEQAVPVDLSGVPAAVGAVLDAVDVQAAVEALRGRDRAVVLGRGLDLPTAHEWALKLQELAGVLAHAWSTADFQHGPIALAENGLPVLVVATQDDHVDQSLTIARRVQERGARVVVLSDRDVDTEVPVVRLPAAGPLTGAFTGIVAAQRVTVAATLLAGRDPDAPRDLRKVTRTR